MTDVELFNSSIPSNLEHVHGDFLVHLKNGKTFSTKLQWKDYFQGFYNGSLVGLIIFIFLLLIFYFISLLRFRRPACHENT